MKTILLTNDDGCHSPGILKLGQYLSKEYNIVIVAPDRERSAVSMGLTLHYPLRIHRIENQVFCVNGTPSDCVNVAVQQLLPKPPDFLISGMNQGENLSEDIFYSGTVAGAFSAYMYGIPSIAVSLLPKDRKYGSGNYRYREGAEITASILAKLIHRRDILNLVYNVNIPYENNGKIMITSLGHKAYRPDIIENVDPRGKKYYWIGTGNPTLEGEKGTDLWAVNHGYISLSTVQYDLNFRGDGNPLAGVFDEI